jgi:hypothetical protein
VGLTVALISGVVFGLGLILSGMINPAKVQNFLDFAGSWDPSLAFVMAGAIGVASLGFKLTLKKAKPLADAVFHIPTGGEINASLVIGAAIFGIGWGLVGLCPGPAVAALTIGGRGTQEFMLASMAGIAVVALARSLMGQSRSQPQPETHSQPQAQK